MQAQCTLCGSIFDQDPAVELDAIRCPRCGVPAKILRRPANFPRAFVWWQDRFHGRTFPFDCRQCRTTIELRQRVTQTNRKCPGCGYQITIDRIDAQLERWEDERQRLMALAAKPFVSPIIWIILGVVLLLYCLVSQIGRR